MEPGHFHHALKIVKEACIGCSHCMSVCPTEAIRVRAGKAILLENRCVDCGQCFKACPVNAIMIEQDDFNRIFNYKHRVALVPSLLVGQFREDVTTERIYNVLLELGFTQVIETEQSVDILSEAYNRYLKENIETAPLISSFCPAVVRLIQVKFPSLVENIILLKPPLDISAQYIKKQLKDSGANEEEIGIFYVTPCAAKIAAIKSPVGEEKSIITGVINMNFIYNKVRTSLKQGNINAPEVSERGHLSKKGILWTLTNGEAKYAEGRAFAIDEIHNVIEFLEKVENEEIKDIDFLELRACDESCAGGVLITANRFLTVERLKNRAAKSKVEENTVDGDPKKCIKNYFKYLIDNVQIDPICPRSMMKLDEDMGEAMKKMDKVKEIMKCLPEVDCCVCGAPTCQSFAEDIVQENAEIGQCIFVQRTLEKAGRYDSYVSIKKMKEIWGDQKFDRKC